MSSACWSLLLVVMATATPPRETTAFQEDAYVSSRMAACNSSAGSRRLACLESRALAWLHEMAGSPWRLELGPASLLPLDHGVVAVESSRGEEEASSGVGGGLLGFAVRQLRKFASGHALMVPVGSAADALHGDVPALVDQDQLTATDTEEQSRGKKKKKKKLALLLPLLFLLKVKLLMVPILLGVLFIKKLLVLAVLVGPTLLGMFKSCGSPSTTTSYHGGGGGGWEHAPPSYHISGGGGGWDHAGSPSLPYHPGPGAGWESSPAGEAIHGEFPDTYGPPYTRRKWGAQSLAYKAHNAAAAASET